VKQKTYNRLGPEQRYQISCLLKENLTLTAIAERIGVHKSTISRELKRNVPARGPGANTYSAENAQNKALDRQRFKAVHFRLDERMLRYMRDKLRNDRWSPELISVKGKEEFGDFVSHETLYKYIWTAKHSAHRYYATDKDLHLYLRHGKRRQKRSNSQQNRGCIPNRICITERPEEANNRSRMGDMEVDIMMSTDHKPGLLVVIDRATLEVDLMKISTKRSDIIAQKLITLLKEKEFVRTITYDNDMAFAKHESVAAAVNADTYFTRPYTSQDKGSVENRIGQIRRWFPKKTDISAVHINTIKSVERKLNNRPVRKFGYKSPNEIKRIKFENVALAS
jgi:transposase, IS30 family